MAAIMQTNKKKRQSSIVAAETVSPAKPKIFIWHFKEKVCNCWPSSESIVPRVMLG